MTAARLLVPLSFTLLSACAQHATQPVELDAESECPTRLQVGQTLTLNLPGNPSTGYRWLVKNAASGVLRSLGPEVYNAPEDQDVVGSAGVSTWRFQVTHTGDAQLQLVYQQPWAADVAPVQTFDCKLVVR